MLVKFASAIGALFTGFALDLTGYVPNAVQSVATLNGIRLIMIGIPIVFVMISFLIFKKRYKLTAVKMKEVMSAIS